MGAAAGFLEGRRVSLLVERGNRFRFPSFLFDKELRSKSQKETGGSSPHYTVLAVTVLGLVCEPPLVFPLSNDLLSSAAGEIPLVQSGSMLLIAWKLCGQISVTRAFRERWLNCSWRVHASPRTLLTSRLGTVGVIGILKNVTIPFFLL